MYSLDGSVSFGNVKKGAIGAIEIYGDGEVLANVSYFNRETGRAESPEIHIFRGNIVDMDDGMMVLRSDDRGIVMLDGIDFTKNTPYEDLITADKSRSTVGIREDVN